MEVLLLLTMKWRTRNVRLSFWLVDGGTENLLSFIQLFTVRVLWFTPGNSSQDSGGYLEICGWVLMMGEKTFCVIGVKNLAQCWFQFLPKVISRVEVMALSRTLVPSQV